MFKETCGEIFGQVRFAGAVAGCGVRSRVRFTCGQNFARTPGSGIYTHFLMSFFMVMMLI